MRIKSLIAVLFLVQTAHGGIFDERALAVLERHQEHIHESARLAGISPRLLASIIYAEQALNVRRGEATVELVLAKMGYNTSVGIAQIKLTTAAWIEEQVWDVKSPFHAGLFLGNRMPPSTTRTELIHRLNDPAQNTLYAAVYAAVIRNIWKDALVAPWNLNRETGIVATVYSLGILTPEGELRTVHDSPRTNRFGETAQEFFDSMILRGEFPK